MLSQAVWVMTDVSHDLFLRWVYSAESTARVAVMIYLNAVQKDERNFSRRQCVTIFQFVELTPSTISLHFIKSRPAESIRLTDRDDKTEPVWLWTSWSCSISYLSMTLWHKHYILRAIDLESPMHFWSYFFNRMCAKRLYKQPLACSLNCNRIKNGMILRRYRDMFKKTECQRITSLIKLCTWKILVHSILMRENT